VSIVRSARARAAAGVAAVLAATLAAIVLAQTVGRALLAGALPAALATVGVVALQSLLLAAVAVLGVGPGEELVFRGVVQGVLARAVSPRAAVLWAAVCFGGLHALAVTGSPLGVLVYLAFASLLGAVLGWSYEATGNLLVPVLAHGGYDAVQFLLQYAGF